MGIISLGKRFGKERLEAACERALFIKGVSYTSIKSILNNNLDQKPLPKQQELLTVGGETEQVPTTDSLLLPSLACPCSWPTPAGERRVWPGAGTEGARPQGRLCRVAASVNQTRFPFSVRIGAGSPAPPFGRHRVQVVDLPKRGMPT